MLAVVLLVFPVAPGARLVVSLVALGLTRGFALGRPLAVVAAGGGLGPDPLSLFGLGLLHAGLIGLGLVGHSLLRLSLLSRPDLGLSLGLLAAFLGLHPFGLSLLIMGAIGLRLGLLGLNLGLLRLSLGLTSLGLGLTAAVLGARRTARSRSARSSLRQRSKPLSSSIPTSTTRACAATGGW